jgi:hypothetical protein
MLKNILIALALVTAAACGEDNNTNTFPDMAHPPSTDMAMQQPTPDMSFVCFDNPTTNDELLNSCAPATVDKVDIVPFFPTLAPNGQLPALP